MCMHILWPIKNNFILSKYTCRISHDLRWYAIFIQLGCVSINSKQMVHQNKWIITTKHIIWKSSNIGMQAYKNIVVNWLISTVHCTSMLYVLPRSIWIRYSMYNKHIVCIILSIVVKRFTLILMVVSIIMYA